jgi:hypothetical protein
LHGDSNPWVGGAGKNIAKFSNNTSINSYGNPTSGEGRVGTGANDYIMIESGKSYVVSFSNSSARAILAVWNGSGLVRRTTGITSGTVLDTSDGTYFFVCIYISDGSITVDEAKAMVEVGTVPTTPYAPYENICPISGWDKAKVTRTGKNLAKLTPNIEGSHRNSTKEYSDSGVKVTSNGTYGRYGWNIPVVVGQTYYIWFNCVASSDASGMNPKVYFGSKDNTWSSTDEG